VRGKGISSTKKSGTATGDLIVTVEVDVPTELTDGEREAIEKLAAATSVSPRSDM
jgi:molecular chaperone DnaJ